MHRLAAIAWPPFSPLFGRQEQQYKPRRTTSTPLSWGLAYISSLCEASELLITIDPQQDLSIPTRQSPINTMTNNTIPHDRHRLRPHHQEMDQLQALAAVKKPQVKKQARRRTHTSRPYQERLLMAEARREIVTALKIHRASTSTRHHHHRQEPRLQLQQQQEQQQQQQVQVVPVSQDRRQQAAVHEDAPLAHITTMSYAAACFANNPLCSSRAAHWIAAGSSSSYCSPPPPILRLPACDLTPPELPTAAAMGGLVELEHCYQGDLERLVRSLPAQPLGLNLSFQGFGVAVDDGANDDCEDQDLLGSLPLTQPPAVETATTHACGGHGSPSPALSAADAEKHSVIDAPPAAAALVVPVLLDGGTTEVMAQQASSTGGEIQGVEWSEAAAVDDVGAWWSKIFESGQRAPPHAENGVAAAGLPPEWLWLCGDDAVGGAAEQGAVTGGVLATVMHVDDGEDVTLPCMDGIGDDVQVWDGEWFSCS